MNATGVSWALAAATSCFVVLAGCTDTVSLQNVTDASADAAPSRVCPAGDAVVRAVAEIPSSFGEPRAMAARDGVVHVVLARSDGSGLVARTRDGALLELAAAPDPVALAVDDRYDYVASKSASAILRVDGDGSVRSATNHAATHLTVGRLGRAYWSTEAQVFTWDFVAAAPTTIGGARAGTAGLAHDENDLFLLTDGALSRLRVATGQETSWGSSCGPGAPALSRDFVHCANGSSIFALSLASGLTSEWATDQPGSATVVTARGRVLWRTATGADRGAVVSRPRDGLGEPQRLAEVDARTSLLATDGCAAYFISGRTIFSRAL